MASYVTTLLCESVWFEGLWCGSLLVLMQRKPSTAPDKFIKNAGK
jgi:hypothetical protein